MMKSIQPWLKLTKLTKSFLELNQSTQLSDKMATQPKVSKLDGNVKALYQ
jgi:hypothetical protein